MADTKNHATSLVGTLGMADRMKHGTLPRSREPFHTGLSQRNFVHCIAKGPLVLGAVRAGQDDETWFELHSPPGARLRLDTADARMHVELTLEKSSGPAAPTQRIRSTASVSFVPRPPEPDFPNGCIRVMVSGLRRAGSYRMHVLESGRHVRNSPFELEVMPGPATEVRVLTSDREVVAKLATPRERKELAAAQAASAAAAAAQGGKA